MGGSRELTPWDQDEREEVRNRRARERRERKGVRGILPHPPSLGLPLFSIQTTCDFATNSFLLKGQCESSLHLPPKGLHRLLLYEMKSVCSEELEFGATVFSTMCPAPQAYSIHSGPAIISFGCWGGKAFYTGILPKSSHFWLQKNHTEDLDT